MKVFVSLCLLCLYGLATANEWSAHLATLGDAEAACVDAASRVCEPFLAAAVGIADTVYHQAVVREDGKTVQIPGEHGKLMICGRGVLPKLNGLTLVHMALASNATPTADWDAVVFEAVNSLCELEKPVAAAK
jgi:hypothetical protein